MEEKQKGSIVLYTGEDGQSQIECHLVDETIWLSQKLLAELFQVTIPTVHEHINNIYAEKELGQSATIRKFLIVQKEGGRAF